MRSCVAPLLAAVALVVGASTAGADPPPTLHAGVLTIGLNMPSPGFEVGSVKGHDVLFARGFDIDLGRAIAAGLGIKGVAFYQEARFDRLIAGGPKPWDIAIGEVTINDARAARLTFSTPYLDVDQGVLVRRGLAPLPRTISDLARLRICTQVSTTAADVVASRVEPVRPPTLYGNVTRMTDALQTGKKCDAVVYDAPILATLRAQSPERFGTLVGVIDTAEQYGVVMPKGSPLEAEVNTVLGRLIATGRISVIARRWLATDVSNLPVLG